jgi:short-subunit dehydrogenase
LAASFNAVVFTFDFRTKEHWSDYEELCSRVSNVGDISILVNAVESFDEGKGKVHKTSDNVLMETLNINTLPMVFLTRYLGPKLKERVSGDKHSAIINMTSYYINWKISNAPIFIAGKSFSDGIS